MLYVFLKDGFRENSICGYVLQIVNKFCGEKFYESFFFVFFQIHFQFQSHQIFHVLVIAAAFVHYHGISEMAMYRVTVGECDVPHPVIAL